MVKISRVAGRRVINSPQQVKLGLNSDTLPIECSVFRGGTSRGIFFAASEVDYPRPVLDEILLSAFGSPDKRQINGLGGTTSVTSKVAIIGPATHPEADVDYTFAQVGVDVPVVDWGGNCGNISAAVGPYCINHGLVTVTGDVTSVRIHNTNTRKLLQAHVPVVGGRAGEAGDCVIPGVPGSGARIMLEFLEPGGAVTGKLMPTGRPVDVISISSGRSYTVSIIDAANPVVFMLAEELEIDGTALPAEVLTRPDVMNAIEEVRSVVASLLGFAQDPATATDVSPGLPKIGFVSAPTTYTTTTGATVDEASIDIVGRLMTMQKPHESYMAAGAICTAAAALLPGTVVSRVARFASLGGDAAKRVVRIGHPYGVLRADATLATGQGAQPLLHSASIERTAREIMSGTLYVPAKLFDPD